MDIWRTAFEVGLRSMEYGEWNSMEYMEWNGIERTSDFPLNSMESTILNSIKIWTFSSIIYSESNVEIPIS